MRKEGFDYNFSRSWRVSLGVPRELTRRKKEETAVLIWKIPEAKAWDGSWRWDVAVAEPASRSWKLIALLFLFIRIQNKGLGLGLVGLIWFGGNFVDRRKENLEGRKEKEGWVGGYGLSLRLRHPQSQTKQETDQLGPTSLTRGSWYGGAFSLSY